MLLAELQANNQCRASTVAVRAVVTRKACPCWDIVASRVVFAARPLRTSVVLDWQMIPGSQSFGACSY